MLETVPFVRLLIHDDVHQLHFRRRHDPGEIARPRATRLRAQTTTAEIIRLLDKLRENVGVLAHLNEELKQHRGD